MKFNIPLEEILKKNPLAIDLASGEKAARKKELGRVTTDIMDIPNIDIVCDLNEGFPFLPDNSVDEIYSVNSLEHIDNLEVLMKEIHRVLKPGGKKHLVVPHFSSPYFYSDPTHKRFFGYYTFYYYSDNQKHLRRKVPAYYFKEKFDIQHIKLLFLTPFSWLRPFSILLGWIVNINSFTQELYEYYFSGMFPCYGLEVILKPVK